MLRERKKTYTARGIGGRGPRAHGHRRGDMKKKPLATSPPEPKEEHLLPPPEVSGEAKSIRWGGPETGVYNVHKWVPTASLGGKKPPEKRCRSCRERCWVVTPTPPRTKETEKEERKRGHAKKIASRG